MTSGLIDGLLNMNVKCLEGPSVDSAATRDIRQQARPCVPSETEGGGQRTESHRILLLFQILCPSELQRSPSRWRYWTMRTTATGMDVKRVGFPEARSGNMLNILRIWLEFFDLDI